MTTSAVKLDLANAVDVSVTDDTLTVELSDGRTISVPIEWYPRLAHGTLEEVSNWRIIGSPGSTIFTSSNPVNQTGPAPVISNST